MTNKSTTTANQTGKPQPIAETKEQPINKVIAEGIRIPVDGIEPNPKQPRTVFDEQELQELAESIKHYDLIQPITVSKLPNGKYRLISGERRWRASRIAGLKDIPAYIRQANDDQLLELAILENLQRKDLRPIEQANAFKRLIEEFRLSIQEIAVRQGKSEYFIRRQIKLTDLLPQWQKIVSKEGIPITIALQIAVLPEAVQKEVYQNHVTKADEKADKPIIQINQYTLNLYKGILTEASFDITDATLDAKIGACTTCPFNTACNALFPDEEKNPRCNNISCFSNKAAIHLKREFDKAKDDPTILLVYEAGYSVPDYIKKLKGEGHEILKLGYSDDCTEIVEPQKPDRTKYEKWAKRQNQSDKEIKNGYKKEVENYEFKKEVFDKNVESGKYKKAFITHSSDSKTGKYVYVEINCKKPKAGATQKAIADGSGSLQDVTNEMTRLQEREKRAIELDGEKVQEKIVQALKDCKTFHEPPKTSNRTDNVLINFLLLESIGYSSRSTVEKIIKQPVSNNLNQFYKWLESLSRQQLSFIARQIILEKYGNSLPNTKGGFVLRKMAESLGVTPIATFEKEQNEKTKKRHLKLKERISNLSKYKQKLIANKKVKPSAGQKGKAIVVRTTKSAA